MYTIATTISDDDRLQCVATLPGVRPTSDSIMLGLNFESAPPAKNAIGGEQVLYTFTGLNSSKYYVIHCSTSSYKSEPHYFQTKTCPDVLKCPCGRPGKSACGAVTFNRIQDIFVPINFGTVYVDVTGISDGGRGGTIRVSSSSLGMALTPVEAEYISPRSIAELKLTTLPDEAGKTDVYVTIASSGVCGNFTSALETFTVTVEETPVDCEWEWAEWSVCSRKCASGRRYRNGKQIVAPACLIAFWLVGLLAGWPVSEV